MSHVEHPITIGLIEHTAEECPAAFKDRAEIVVPALRAAADQIPDTLIFSTKDHGGVFVADGTKAEVEVQLPEIPIHEVTLKDASADEITHSHLRDPSKLQTSEEERRAFLRHSERYFPDRFPKLNEGPVLSGAELADFIESQHA